MAKRHSNMMKYYPSLAAVPDRFQHSLFPVEKILAWGGDLVLPGGAHGSGDLHFHALTH